MSDDDKKVVPLRRTGGKCPICGKAADRAYRPFCSKRCADIDLGRWLKEDYRIASDDEPDMDEGPYGEE